MQYRIRNLAVLLALIPVFVTPSIAARLYVNLNASGPAHNGASWPTAYLKISDAIAAAAPTNGAEIWVAAGKYQETVTVPSLIYGIGLYGGFAGTETDRSQRNSASNITIIDAQYNGTVVTFQSGVFSGTVLDGFRLTNGTGTPYANSSTGKTDLYGGGILCKSWSSPTISNNNIVSNEVGSYTADRAFGGGIAVLGGNPVIDGNQITSNLALNFGGGIYAASGTYPRITNNVIQGNTGELGGGGIYAPLGTYIGHDQILGNTGSGGGCAGVQIDGTTEANVNAPTTTVEYNYIKDNDGGAFEHSGTNPSTVGTPFIMIHDNFISGNKGDSGSAFFLLDSYAHIYNNTIINNVAKNVNYERGVIYAFNATGTGAPILENNIFAYNSAGYLDGTVDGMHPFFFNNCFYSNGSYDYKSTNANPDPTTSNGNIKVDPKFAHLSNTTAVDYRLSAGSPCRDTGYDAAVSNTSYDLDGEPRLDGAHVDMGAWEFVSGVTLSFITQPSNVNVNEHMTPAPQVTALRSNGQICPHASAVWISIKPGTGTSGAHMYADSSLDSGIGAFFVNGVATLPHPYFDLAGTGYVLTANWAGVTTDSQPFKVTLPRRFVTTAGNDANDGSSWAKAKLTPASALDELLSPGGEVWVAGGTYNGTFTLPAGAQIYGGFGGTEAYLYGRFSRTNETILNGGQNGSVVTVASNAGADTIVDNFTITNGSGRAFLDLNRHAVFRGGGLYCAGGSPTIQWNHITGNTATQGAGIYCDSGSPVIASNIIESNAASANFYYAGSGGGIALVSAPAMLVGNLIRNNSSTGSLTLNHPASIAGAILCRQSDAIFRNNTVAGNTASSDTSIEVVSANPRFANNIIYAAATGVNASTDSTVDASYNDLFSTGGTAYTGPGTPFTGHRNLNMDPLFVNAATGNHRLQDTSPCINRGYNGIIADGAVDLDGIPRIEDFTVDQGAYEHRVFDVLTLEFVDITHLRLTYSDTINSNPAYGAYIPTNYTVVDTDNSNAALPVTVVNSGGITGSQVSLVFASLPLGHHVKVTVSNVKGESGLLVNPARNYASVQIPVYVTFDLVDYTNAHSGHALTVHGTSSGESTSTFSIPLSSVYGTYEAVSTQKLVAPGVLTYRYVLDGTDNTTLNETDRTFTLTSANPQTIHDTIGADVKTTLNLFIYADKAIPAGKDVYVTGGFCNWSATPGATPAPVKMSPSQTGAVKGLFSATTTVKQSAWAYRYVLIDRTTSVADSSYLNAADRVMDMRAYGTPPSFVVNDSVGTATTIEQVVRILRITAGLEPAPSPQTDPSFTSLDLDSNARINLIDAIKLLRG